MTGADNVNNRITPELPADAPRGTVAGAGAECTLDRPVTLIGSRRDVDLFIDESGVGKTHCAIVNTGRELVLVDLCSRAGTFVGDQKIRIAPLANGAAFRIGKVVLAIRVDAPHEASADAQVETGGDAHVLTLQHDTGATELEQLPAIIGRRHTCEVVVDTPDVSLTHALLFPLDGVPAIFDLGSRSGTYVNGERTALGWLADGDRLEIGGDTLNVGWDGPGPAAPEPEPEPAALASETPPAVTASAWGGLAALGEIDLQSGDVNDLPPIDALLAMLKCRLQAEAEKVALRARELHEQEATVNAKAAAVEQQAIELTEQRAANEAALVELEATRAETRQQEQAFRTKQSEMIEWENALAKRESRLEAAESLAAQRQQQIDQRETAVADTLQKIEQFRGALDQARSTIHSVEATSGLDTEPDADAQTPATGKAGRASNGKSARRMPAPVVDRPIFAIDGDPAGVSQADPGRAAG